MKTKYITLFLATLLLPLLFSCDFINNKFKQEEPKTYLSELMVCRSSSVKLIYKDNVLFTGTAWSSDGAAVNIECQNGELIAWNCFHPNGNEAVYIDFRHNQRIWSNSLNERTADKMYTLYNDKGAPLIKFCRNTESLSNAVFQYTNIDKTSQSYGENGCWNSNHIPYPYEDFETIILRCEAIVKNELPSKD